MEKTQPSPLIARFRFAHSQGARPLADFSKRGLCQKFLRKAHGALWTLYGPKAPVVCKYLAATRNFRDITEGEYYALFVEFGHILKHLEFISAQDPANPRSQACPPPPGKNVFVIHGHDELNTRRLSELLQNDFGLNPILMMRKAGIGRGLLQKYEDAASTCSMAFALMTPDDEITNDEASHHQARPNVIFETGWFVGRLGIPQVCLLLKEGTKVHSDIDGISRIQFRDDIGEKVREIKRELEEVGMLKA